MCDRSMQCRAVALVDLGGAHAAFGASLAKDFHDGVLGRRFKGAAGYLAGFLQELFGFRHGVSVRVVVIGIFHNLTLLPTLLLHEIFLIGVLKNAARTRG